eukprot:2177688-Rhodomonas_salina.1
MTEEDAAALAAAAPLQAFGATPQGWQESLDWHQRILGDCVARKALGFVGGEPKYQMPVNQMHADHAN